MTKRKPRKKKEVYEFVRPVEGNLVVTKPAAIGGGKERVTDSGLVLPSTQEYIRATFGLVTKVLRVAEDLKEKFPIGTTLLIHEHGGHEIYSHDGGTAAWVISEGDVMALVDEAYWKEFGA